MSTDRELLIFLHERLVHVHKENDCVGYMHQLRGIIAGLPPDQRSDSTCTNSLRELQRKLPRMDALKREGWLLRWARRRVEQAERAYQQLPILEKEVSEVGKT